MRGEINNHEGCKTVKMLQMRWKDVPLLEAVLTAIVINDRDRNVLCVEFGGSTVQMISDAEDVFDGCDGDRVPVIQCRDLQPRA
jgi:hypothetical protein